MGTISGKVKKCYEKYQEIGTVQIKFSVAPTGQITTASATGKF